MIEEKYTFAFTDLNTLLLPLLRNQVFHVTEATSYKRILESGYIDHNKDDKYQKTWSRESYGSKRELVCLFDLRNISDFQIENNIYRCDFLNDRRFGNITAYLILPESCFQNIIQNKVAVNETKCEEFFVPKLEAWHPGKIPLNCVAKVLLVTKV